MKNVCLIACASKKLAFASPAQDLYQSALFSKSVTWMKGQNFDGWFILSAKHALVSPDTVLDPYDLTLKTMNTAQKRQWSATVLSDLLDVLDESASVTFLAGNPVTVHLSILVRLPVWAVASSPL
jgi:hypothetical protein